MIRPFGPEDAPAAVRLLALLVPDWAVTERGLLHALTGEPDRAAARFWLAEEGGEAVGFARGRVRWEVSSERVGSLWAGVAPERRRRGLGSDLFAAAQAHLRAAGARTLESWAEEEAGGRFLVTRGFREVRPEQISILAPREAELASLSELEAARAREGFRLARLGDVLDRPRELHALDAAVRADIPEEFPEDALGYEDWQRDVLGNPDLSRDGSFVVVHGERPVALALLVVSEAARRAENELTGTLPEFRRRGLARLAKLATIRWAAERGIEAIVTGNDAANAAMLALNRSLGYQPLLRRGFYLKPAADH